MTDSCYNNILVITIPWHKPQLIFTQNSYFESYTYSYWIALKL